MRWYLRYGLSYRDVEELLAERGVDVDHVTVYPWVQRFTPEFISAARPRCHCPGERWFVDETYVKVAGRWTYLYRTIDQHGQVIDIWLSRRRDLTAARALQPGGLTCGTRRSRSPPTGHRSTRGSSTRSSLALFHVTQQYANSTCRGRPWPHKARLRPMRGLKRFRSARILAAGHALVQNIRRGYYEIASDQPAQGRLRAAFDELMLAV